MALTPEQNPYDVSVGQVHHLVPFASLDLAADQQPPGTSVVAAETVEEWITMLSAGLSGRLAPFGDTWIESEPRTAQVFSLAQAIVANGVAWWWTAAMFPTHAGLNEQSSYAADLRSRYTTGIDSLIALLTLWRTQGGPDEPPGGADGLPYGISALFPAPQFPDYFGV